MSASDNSEISPVDSDEFKKQSDNIQNLSEISKNSRTTFMAILLAAAYCYLTIGQTSDAALISNSIASPLPIIQAEVPIVRFYFFAPIILFLMFVYFHLYLQRFWRCVAALPLVHEDGRTLDDYIYPWLISSAFLRAEIDELRKNKHFHIPLESAISIFVAWWFVPVILVFFWARYLVVHDWAGTILHIILIVLSVTSAIRFYCAAKIAVSSDRSKTRCTIFYLQPNTCTTTGGIVSLVFLSFLAYGAIEGAPKEDCRANTLPQCSFLFSGGRLLEFIGYSPFANIENQKLTKKPDNWSALITGEKAEEKIAELSGPVLIKDLRFANAKQAFLVSSDFRNAKMQHIKLNNAILVAAKMTNANLDGGTLKKADLQWADLTDAQLNNTDLTQAKLHFSILKNTDLSSSQLIDANLHHAIGLETDFSNADLRFVNLSDAHFPGAKFVNSNLPKANLLRAQLEGSNFSEADLQFANLSESTITNSNFHNTDLQSANLKNAYIDESKFTDSNLEQASLKFVFAYKAEFTNVKLMAATLDNADLRETTFTDTDLTDAYFDNSDLSNAVFNHVKLVRVNFGNSELYNTVIKNSDLSGAILTNTKGLNISKLVGSCGNTYTKLPFDYTIPLCTDNIKQVTHSRIKP